MGGPVTYAMEATALTFNFHLIDIYVCSWGPRDDGAEMDGPNVLVEQALQLGTHRVSPSDCQTERDEGRPLPFNSIRSESGIA